MSDRWLRAQIIRVAKQNPETRDFLLPLARQAAADNWPKNQAERKLADELEINHSFGELMQLTKEKPSKDDLEHYKVDAAGWTRAVKEALRMSKEKSSKKASLNLKGSPWMRRVNAIRAEFMAETVEAAISILKSEGATKVVQSAANQVRGNYQNNSFEVTWEWLTSVTGMEVKVRWGTGRRDTVSKLLLESPDQLASESLYEHFQGFIS